MCDHDPVAGRLADATESVLLRSASLNAVARRALQAWLQVRPEVSEGHVFIVVERSHHVPLSSRSVQRAIRRYGELAGLPKLTPHMFRHTFAQNR